MRAGSLAGAITGILASLLIAAGQARAQGASEDAGSDAYLLMNGAAARVSEDPVGSLDLSGDQRLSVRTYQYRDFSGGTARQPYAALGYRPYRDGDLDPAKLSGIDDLSKAWDYGGILEYGFSDPDDPRNSAGINIRIAPGEGSVGEGWLLQPGASYSRPVSDRWQFNARVYSTIMSPSPSANALQLDRQTSGGSAWMNGDSAFQDVGVNLGLNYDVNENWRLGTGAGVSRMIGRPGDSSAVNDEPSATQFFGGVVLKYKF